ncbi:winged helix DNA-binding domain-containing protein [Mumia sp. zg.B17]|uniref:winged helix DNA-binding domain-containing protein n=2 Tax=unclassified Mumia TaxID=2621872 RepID=UPI001C6E2AA7|nr:winged helix DNA-binding domain-containing protein [Mumia sp. zg.B17]MBW9205269.1 winged helix DNA-binding domain-containing protein [Mumia sp. zg.B17]
MRITDEQRRHRLMVGHRVGVSPSRSTPTVEEIVRGVLVLHATDPATVYLSVLARAGSLTIADVREAMYERRTLVRVLAMRRTLFVADREDLPVIHAGASLGVARMLRTRLLKQLATLPTDPPVPDPATWLAHVEGAVGAALREAGTATGAQLSEAVPELRTAILPTTDKAWDVRRTVTSPTLALLSAEGRMVRTEPRGSWTSRHHTWAPMEAWFPSGLPDLPEADARVRLAERWLEAFGPATGDDLQWWTGWNKTQTRAALAGLDLVDVELSEGQGVALSGTEMPDAPEPGATLLPALDPTPMGWKHRGWYLGEHRERLFDRMGNIGPTVWWDGRIVGGWAVRPDGEVVYRLLEDVGADATETVDQAAAQIQARLDGATVTASFPTPLERELRA